MIRRPPRSTLFPYTTALPISRGNVPRGLRALRRNRRRRVRATGAAREGVRCLARSIRFASRSEEHTSELQSRQYLVCRLLLEKKNLLRLRRRHIFIRDYGRFY